MPKPGRPKASEVVLPTPKTKKARIEAILETRQAASFSDIARSVGSSREYVRKIAHDMKFKRPIPAGHISIPEAAVILRMTTMGVRKAIKGGRLKGVKVGYRLWVDKQSVKDFKKL